MPMPESLTFRTAVSSAVESLRSIRPAAGVYFTALPSRLVTICSSRIASPVTTTGSSGSSTRSAWAREWMPKLAASIA